MLAEYLQGTEWLPVLFIPIVILFICLYPVTETQAESIYSKKLITVVHGNHSYILNKDSNVFIHDPDCKCRKEGNDDSNRN